MNTYRFQVYTDRGGEHRWRLLARNQRVVADSGEGYKTRRGVLGAIKRLQGARLAVAVEMLP